MKVKLEFPENDKRSNGESIHPKRPWLKQGATGETLGRKHHRYTVRVKFDEAPPKEYDMVSKCYLKPVVPEVKENENEEI